MVRTFFSPTFGDLRVLPPSYWLAKSQPVTRRDLSEGLIRSLSTFQEDRIHDEFHIHPRMKIIILYSAVRNIMRIFMS